MTATPHISPAEMHLGALERHVPIRGLRLLDVGCGAGDFVRLTMNHGADAHGMEVEDGAIARAVASGLDPSRIRKGDGSRLPYEDHSFDVVSFVFSFHHVPPALHTEMLGEVARVLKPGGHMVAFDPRPFGEMTEVIMPIEDETEVRTKAQMVLSAPVAPFAGIASEEYEIERRFANFDALLDAVVAVDPARRAKAADPAVRAETERRFDSHVGPSETSEVTLKQPTVFVLWRRD
ncbi:MAG: class I SAM-dependent methyltransferase [Pseudomonadota bacterium]|nr:class I SAM-dependent methyltransferase [Pseudomonadota bacterium]